MFELFLNPANMVLGGLLISSPIIIHLINRMRFKRIRWAAMEFLLKSQKRNRRRLIIEQLILLALRILLVLLAGLLLARFLGFSYAGLFQPQNTTHVVVLDDRLSMTDHWKGEDGERKTCFTAGKQIVEKEIVKNILRARSPQRVVVLRLSDPQQTLFDQRLTDDSANELGKTLAPLEEATAMHLDLVKGLQAAEAIFDQAKEDQKFLHILSDFRQRHWEPSLLEGAGAESPGLLKELEALAKRVKINLVDTAHPHRSDNEKTPRYHDNLAIVELRPETRIAAEGMPVQMSVTVANFSNSERKNIRVAIKVEGIERLESSVQVESLAPGEKGTKTTFVTFDKLGFNQVSANLENEEVGLQADNVCHALVEVRRQVPILLIDGDPSEGDKAGGDTYHLRALFTVAHGYEIVRGGVRDLERPNLQQYASIYLLNVPELTPAGLKNLEKYTAEGGSVAFFLGEKVRPDYYNKSLFANGKGLFPAPLGDRPSAELTDEQRQEKRLQDLAEPHMQLFVRDPGHPVFAEVAKYKTFFMFLNMDRHFPVPRQKWNPEPGEELATLPNQKSTSDYESTTQGILNALIPDEEKYSKYRPALEKHRRNIRNALSGKALHVLADALTTLLEDAGKKDDPDQPNLKDEFWRLTDRKIQDLRSDIEKLRETVQYGDPLVIAHNYGKGRTVAFLTTAGTKWNDWAGGGAASMTYPIVVLDLQKFLSSTSREANRLVGTPLALEVESSRYEGKMHVYFQPETRDPAKAGAGPRAGMQDLGEESGTESGGRVSFVFNNARQPGIYFFDLRQRTEAAAEARTETRAFAFNVDTLNESDLQRASRNELEKVAVNVTLQTAGTNWAAKLADRKSDLSESAWFYLVFLLILVVEQAMAVHLSFHLKGAEAELPPQAVKPQAAAA